ncbi:MAG: archaemetzincin family Zn-dependent metalloprotease [Bacteroidales bacterium]
MSSCQIILIPCDHFEEMVIRKITDELKLHFGFPVTVRECHNDITEHYNPSRRQYDANKLLQMIGAFPGEKAVRIIGLYRVDLYIPVLTYIFGQAILGGEKAVASLYRLRNELYGMPKDDALTVTRFTKVIVHEMGHSFGLVHCQNPECIMRSSTYVEDIDQKKLKFCPTCREELDQLTIKA